MNLFQALVLAPVDNVQDVVAELHVIFGLLKQETIDLSRIVFELIMLPGYVESCLRAVHSDAECGTVDRLDPFVLALFCWRLRRSAMLTHNAEPEGH